MIDSSFESLESAAIKNNIGVTIGSTINMSPSDIVPGAFGQALQFSQPNQRGIIAPTPALSSLGSNNADFSLSFWYRLDAAADGTYRVVLFKGNNDLERGPGLWMMPDSNRLHVRVSTSVEFNEGFNSVGSLTVGSWTHIVVAKTGSQWSLFLNGQLDSQITLAGTTLGNTGPLYLGGTPWQLGAKGAIDELEIFNKSLSQPEIDLLHLQPQQKYLFTQGNVSTNDSDPNGDSMTFALVSSALGSRIDFKANGAFQFAMPPAPSGGQLFSYKAIDVFNSEDIAIVTSTLTTNDPPAPAEDFAALAIVQRAVNSNFETISGTTLKDSNGVSIGSVVNMSVTDIVPGSSGNALQFSLPGQQAIIGATPQLSALGANGSDFSISFRYRLDETANGLYRVVMFKGENDLERGPGIWMRPESNRLHVQISTSVNFNEGLNSTAELTVGQWTQVVVMKQGSLWSLYLDGQLDNQVELAGTTLGNDGPLYLGSTPWQDGARAAFDELEVFGKALSKAELLLVQSQPNELYRFAQGDVSLNDSDPNGDVLTYQLATAASGSIVDLEPNGKFSFVSTANPISDTLFSYKAVDTALLENFADVTRAAGLNPPDAVNDVAVPITVTRVTDSSFQSIAGGAVFNNAGVAIGSTLGLTAANLVASPFGTGLNFTAAGQRAVIAATPQLNALGANDADFSISFWYRLNETANGLYRVVMFKGADDFERGPGIWMRPDNNRLHVQISTSVNFNEGLNSVAELTVGQWSQVTVMKQGSLWSLYVNGQLDSQMNLAGATLGNNGPLYLGSTPWQAGANGTMDELEIFDRALTPPELALLQTQPNSAYKFVQGDVSLNDSDPDGDTLAYQLVSTAAGSQVSLAADGTFAYATTASTLVSPLFTYTVIDTSNREDQGLVNATPNLRGLVGEYFDNADLTNKVVVRNDPNVDFDWGLLSPAVGVGEDTFSVRWHGQIEPQFTETYTFHTFSANGVRLWVNDQLIINEWTAASPKVSTGTIALSAGQRYKLRMEYTTEAGIAEVQLAWSSPHQPLEVIPEHRLYQAAGVIGLATSVISVNETAGNIAVSVVRQLGAEGTISVDYRTVATTATAGQDYTASIGTLTFLTGETVKQVIIPIANDTLSEANETFTFTIDNVTGGA